MDAAHKDDAAVSAQEELLFPSSSIAVVKNYSNLMLFQPSSTHADVLMSSLPFPPSSSSHDLHDLPLPPSDTNKSFIDEWPSSSTDGFTDIFHAQQHLDSRTALMHAIRHFVTQHISDDQEEPKPVTIWSKHAIVFDTQCMQWMRCLNTPRTSHTLSPTAYGGRRYAVIFRVLQIVYSLLHQNIYATKRDLFYMDVKLFGTQVNADNALDDLASHFDVSRYDMHVVSSPKGLVHGTLRIILTDGICLNCANDTEPVQIPQHESIASLESAQLPQFMLVIEKAATLSHLISSRFRHIAGPCILITGKGYPDVATRRLVQRIHSTFSSKNRTFAVYALMDNDPYGLDILATYKFGSKKMADSLESLALPCIQWLGLFHSDWHRFKVPDEGLLNLTTYDRKRGMALLNEPWMQMFPEWKREVVKTLFVGKKAELQALTMFHTQDSKRGLMVDYLMTKINV